MYKVAKFCQIRSQGIPSGYLDPIFIPFSFQIPINAIVNRGHYGPYDDFPRSRGPDRPAGSLVPHRPRLLRLHLLHVHLFNRGAGEIRGSGWNIVLITLARLFSLTRLKGSITVRLTSCLTGLNSAVLHSLN